VETGGISKMAIVEHRNAKTNLALLRKAGRHCLVGVFRARSLRLETPELGIKTAGTVTLNAPIIG